MTENFSLENIKNIHFIGIGGIGMSGLARLMKAMNFNVGGSDLKDTNLTQVLKKENIKVKIGHSQNNISKNTDLVVISSAIDYSNPELKAALKKKIPIIKRAKLLSELCKNKKTIAITGTHGKTTTSSMIATTMDYIGANSTNIVGGIVKNIDSNIKIGKSEYFVIEADESDGSFLYFSPLIACVTNIDNDHLDFYKNMNNLKNTFALFLSKVPFYGRAIICADDKNLMEIVQKLNVPFYSYGFSKTANWQAYNIKKERIGISFDILYKGKKEQNIKLKVFGLHNVKNALCCYSAIKYLGFNGKEIAKGLENFAGVKRRIELIGKYKEILFFDDYGHHPTEIKNTLNAIKNFYPQKRIITIFQPHRYTRTKILYKDFGNSFNEADIIYVMPIYPADEKPIKGITSKIIIEALNKNGKKAFPYPGSIDIAKNLKDNDILLTIGAGDVWKIGQEIKYKLENLY